MTVYQAKKRLQDRRARIKHSHEEAMRSIEEAMNLKFDEISRRVYVREQDPLISDLFKIGSKGTSFGWRNYMT